MCQHACHQLTYVQIRGSRLQEAQTHKQERETEDELTQTLPAGLMIEYQRQTESQQRNGEGRDIHLKAYSRDNPGSDCSTHVGTHNDTNRLFQRHQASVHKGNHHNGRGTGRLNQSCDKNTCENTHDPIFRHGCQDRAKPVARELCQTLTHDLHSIKEETQRAQKR